MGETELRGSGGVDAGGGRARGVCHLVRGDFFANKIGSRLIVAIQNRVVFEKYRIAIINRRSNVGVFM
jgi:hypothetical protein